MSERNFRDLLEYNFWDDKFVCVGLDSEFDKIPLSAFPRNRGGITVDDVIFEFNRAIVEATKDLVCAYKPNIAFYMARGAEGITALKGTIDYILMAAPNVPIILDAKVADIGNTNNGYTKMAFGYFRADAITVHPYLGAEASKPFLDQKNKGIFVLCRTSNQGAGEFQDLSMDNVPLYQQVAHNVAERWNANGNCGVVVGATYPDELREVRKIVEDMPILIPGIGVQGGDIEKTVLTGKNSLGEGMIINSSRGIIYASNGPDFAEAARRETEKLHNQINSILNP